MFNDNGNEPDDMWFTGDDPFPDAEHPQVIPLDFIRDVALRLFWRMIAERSGLDGNKYNETTDLSDTQRDFLSIDETEQIVRAHSALDNGEVMAVGGNSKAEAMQQVRVMVNALVVRVMSNVTAEAARRDLVDVSYDDAVGSFAFQVNENGRREVAQNKELFDENV